MSDDLLAYYNQELAYLRQAGQSFAREHPKIAGRLRLGVDSAEDPHVERLIEALAFLNGRIQSRLDDEFPEISEALLGILSPHSLAPFPSMSVVQFDAANDATAEYVIDRGTELRTERVGTDDCTYRTTYETSVWPLKIESASVLPTPFTAPPCSFARQAVACLQISIRPTEGVSLAELGLDRLRLHLGGLPQHAYPLYEVLLNDVGAVCVAQNETDKKAIELDPNCLRPVGFAPEESLLPPDPRSSAGQRLLAEFFGFPKKFLFVDLCGLKPASTMSPGGFEVFLYLRRLPKDLDQFVSAESFRINCSPIVNLFRRRAEPIRMDHVDTEARVVPDARRVKAMEVFSIDEVTAVSDDGKSREVRPFYGIEHGPDSDASPAFWHASRRPAAFDGDEQDPGTEVYLQVVDLDFDAADLRDSTLTVSTTCTNRELPGRLPFGAGHPNMSLAGGGSVSAVNCLYAPTSTRRPKLRGGARWKLISKLALNHLTLSMDGGNLEAMQEHLRVNEVQGNPESSRLVESILALECEPAVTRISSGGQSAYCRGLQVTVTLDESKFSGSGLFLFASVLERFIGHSATVNSFTKLRLKTNLRDEVVKTWRPRAGHKTLL